MSEQQANCAATQRKLLEKYIWSDLTALEISMGNAQDYADIFCQLADKLDPKDPIHRAYMALAYAWSAQLNQGHADFIRLTNRIVELRNVA